MRSMVAFSVLLMSTGQNNAAQLVSRGVLANAGHALWTTACTHKKKVVGMLALGGVGAGTYAYSKKKANDHKLAQKLKDEEEQERSRLEIDRRQREEQAAQDLREKMEIQELLEDRDPMAERRLAIGGAERLLEQNPNEKDPKYLSSFTRQINESFAHHRIDLQFDIKDTDSLKDALEKVRKLAIEEHGDYVNTLTAYHEKWKNKEISEDMKFFLERLKAIKRERMGQLELWKLQLKLAQDQARKGAVKSNVFIDGIIKHAQELVKDRDENADRRKFLEMRIENLNQSGGDKPTLKEALEEGIGEWESYRVQLASYFEESRNIAGSNQAGSLSLDKETREAVEGIGVATHGKQTDVSFRLKAWKKQLDGLKGNGTVVAGGNGCDLVWTSQDEADLGSL